VHLHIMDMSIAKISHGRGAVLKNYLHKGEFGLLLPLYTWSVDHPEISDPHSVTSNQFSLDPASTWAAAGLDLHDDVIEWEDIRKDRRTATETQPQKQRGKVETGRNNWYLRRNAVESSRDVQTLRRNAVESSRDVQTVPVMCSNNMKFHYHDIESAAAALQQERMGTALLCHADALSDTERVLPGFR
jgi:hypothetical protein